jgi:hypothetical protein
VLALSRISAFILSDDVVDEGVIEWARVLSVERIWVRLLCTKEAVCYVAPLTSFFH